MREFAFFITSKAVKKQSPDKHLASALMKESKDRLQLAKTLSKIEKPKYVVENAYEAIREQIDAILYAEGFKSYSHEASVAYLSELGFSATEIGKVDRLRKLRNGIKYYGEEVSQKDATGALVIAEELIRKIVKEEKA